MNPIYLMLNALLTKQDKKALGGLVVLSIFVSCFEMLCISLIMFFISAATDFSYIHKSRFLGWLYKTTGLGNPQTFVIALGITIAACYVIRGFINIAHGHAMATFSYTRYQRLAKALFSKFLHLPYQDFTQLNSANINQTIFSHTAMLTQFMFALLTLFAEGFTVICVYGMLFWVNWKMTFILTILLSVQSVAAFLFFSRRIAKAGKNVQIMYGECGKIFNEAVGNFKVIKLAGHESFFMQRLASATQGYSSAYVLYTTLQAAPRFVLETLSFVLLVCIVIYVLFAYGQAEYVMPIVSLYALAFYRLLPSLTRILSSFNQMTFTKGAVQGVYDFLQQGEEQAFDKKSISFTHGISLENISFGYTSSHPVLKNISLHIDKGQRIAFVGASGVGKSTLVDIIMGFYQPTHGQLLVDGKALQATGCHQWRSKFGYVPQTVYLFDGTVGDNVVLGSAYNEPRIVDVLCKAHIYDFLLTKQGLQTRVGEGGIQLSGGQKQRIAIARALYQSPEILVLDEATSALDHATEEDVMRDIYQLSRDLTIIVISHRLSSVARCDKIYNIEHGTALLQTTSANNEKQEALKNHKQMALAAKCLD